MQHIRRTHTPVSSGLVWMAVVLLAGVLILGIGYFDRNDIAFYSGVFVIIGGVINGMTHLVAHRAS